MLKYNDKVRVTSGFYEGMEGIVIDYMRYESGGVEKPYELEEGTWHPAFGRALTKDEKAYKILDEKRNIILRYKVGNDFIPESSLELIK